MTMWKIPLFSLDYDESEIDAANSALRSGWLTTGPRTEEFENRFSDYLGNGVFSTAVSSCTAALHLALLSIGVKAGDEVIISGLSFVAALNVVTLTGAKPILADSKSLADWNVNPSDIEKKITPNTKALIIVHFAGYACDMREISEIAQKHGITLIEDTAHAAGASYGAQKCGTIGDFGCFSFFSNKNLSVGEGGMIVTPHKELHEKARSLRSHGMTSMTIDRHRGDSHLYDVLLPGLNYRFDEIRAAIGIQQLLKLDGNNHKRRRLAQRYRENLVNTRDIELPWMQRIGDETTSAHIFPVLLAGHIDRQTLRSRLHDDGIQTSVHYPAYSDFSYYKNAPLDDLPVASAISNRALTLPLYPSLADSSVDEICGRLSFHISRDPVL